MRLGLGWLVGCVLGIGFVFARSAWADLRVVLAVPDAAEARNAQTATRLQAELVAAGFEVRTVPSTAAPSILLLKALAEREGGAAAIAIVSSPVTVSGIVWMRDELARRVLVRRVPEERWSIDSPAVFAIRTTDLLHGGLLQLGYPRPKPPATASGESAQDEPAAALVREPAAAAPRTAAKTARSAPREPAEAKTGDGSGRDAAAPAPAWEILAGASSLWGPSGDSEALPWMLSPALGLQWRPLSAWALELRAVAPAFGSAASSPDAVKLDQELVLLGAGWRGRLGWRVHGAASAGAGLYRLGVRAEQRTLIPPDGDRRPGGPPGGPPSPTEISFDHSEVYWFVCAYSGAGLELHLDSRIAVRALGDLVVPAKRATIRLPDRRTAQSGVPILVGTLALALEL